MRIALPPLYTYSFLDFSAILGMVTIVNMNHILRPFSRKKSLISSAFASLEFCGMQIRIHFDLVCSSCWVISNLQHHICPFKDNRLSNLHSGLWFKSVNGGTLPHCLSGFAGMKIVW